MKWNGSIYYNVVSQDNVGEDRAALKQVPCPEPSLLITRGTQASLQQTKPGSATV